MSIEPNAILENAKHVEEDALHLGKAVTGNGKSKLTADQQDNHYDHLFFQRVKLLAVMLKAVAKGYPMDDNRKSAMQENLEMICNTMMFQDNAEDIGFLQVA